MEKRLRQEPPAKARWCEVITANIFDSMWFLTCSENARPFYGLKSIVCVESIFRHVNTKKPVYALLKKTKNHEDRNIIKKYLEHLCKEEKADTKYLRLAIWIIQVNK